MTRPRDACRPDGGSSGWNGKEKGLISGEVSEKTKRRG
jgi:hypothetical protein